MWDGEIKAAEADNEYGLTRLRLADAAKTGDWPVVLDLLGGDRYLVNSSRPGGKSLYAPLHQAAYNGASADVVNHLIRLGAFRTLRNARGERALDVAQRRGHRHLQAVLAPVLHHQVPGAELVKMQAHFHAVIRGRIDEPLADHGLRLPQLAALLELERPHMWFPVPGMCGGFSYWLESGGAAARLVAESWSRVSGGSGQRHEITPQGSELVDEGFV
ncbi:ankyrin repeat domain-containing protein [Massilia violaceinigra]|uniref:Ankyrin repeat domain-containing protein n=2 Tax=Massilia violaceinigra TaxID=2045208 RepID=A0ABY4AFD8_9BURK|nr:ankyrin repeat domain-containing protein [Massilia violaceinigra]